MIKYIAIFFFAALLFCCSSTTRPTVSQTPQDTIQPKTTKDATDVKGKHCLFIGDSHTCNGVFGYQKVICDQTGMTHDLCAKGGMTTTWMLDNGFLYLSNDSKHYDYCFIYGGANDAYNSVSPSLTIMNIQSLVKLCVSKKIKCFVITGFNPNTCVRDNNNTVIAKYKVRYNNLQNMMLSQLTDCQVIDTRGSVEINDCADGFCHMKKTGHLKLGSSVVDSCGFKRLTAQ